MTNQPPADDPAKAQRELEERTEQWIADHPEVPVIDVEPVRDDKGAAPDAR